jgi:hypothetical protein
MPLPFSSAFHRQLGLITGSALIIAAPLVGVIPGPGGIVLFALGLGLVLRSSRMARKLYVRFKRRWPRYGNWTDRALRSKVRQRQKHKRSGQNPPVVRDKNKKIGPE